MESPYTDPPDVSDVPDNDTASESSEEDQTKTFAAVMANIRLDKLLEYACTIRMELQLTK